MVVEVLKRILNKRNAKSNHTPKKWFQKKKNARNETHANSRAKKNVLCAKEKMNGHRVKFEKESTVNEGWELAKKLAMCF